MCNKNMEIGFQGAVFTSVNERCCHYCIMTEARIERPLFRARENPAKHFLSVFSDIMFNSSSTRCSEGRSLGYQVLVIRFHFLAITAMEAQLPPFTNREHNSKSVSTLDCGLHST